MRMPFLVVPSRILPADSSELVSFESNNLNLERNSSPEIFFAAPPDSIRNNLEHPDNIICCWFLCFEKGSPILEEVIVLIVRYSFFFKNKQFEDPHLAGVHLTGPLAPTQAIWIWMKKAGKWPRQYGIDFSGHGIWRLPIMDYSKSPRHSIGNSKVLLE